MWLQYFQTLLCSSGSAVSILFIISLAGTSALGRIFARGSDHEEYSGLFSDFDVVEINEGLDEDMSLLQDEHFQEIMMLVQQLPREERRDRNQSFMRALSNKEGGLANGLIWVKEELHPSTSKILMEDHDFTATWMERLIDTINDLKKCVKIKCSRGEESRYDILSLLTRFKAILFIYADILKDAMVVMALLSILGLAFFWDIFSFSSLITWILLFSIIIPLAISTCSVIRKNPTIILGWKTWAKYKKEDREPSWKELLAMRLVAGFLWFAVPALIINAQEEAKAARKKLLESMARDLGKDNTVPRTSLGQLHKLNNFLEASGKQILIFRTNELGLEIVIQLVIQLLMLLLSPTYTTHTATHAGLQAIFETDFASTAKLASDYGVNIPGKLEDITKGLIIFSLLWSIKTAATSYIKVKTEEKLELFTLFSKLVLGLRSLLVYAVRILCMLAFFGPPLGLIDCLAHWKAAQLEENPPDFTEWTVIGLGQSLAVFSGLLLLQMTFMTMLKCVLSKDFKKAIMSGNLTSIVQHLVLTVNIPDNYKDWDQSEGGPGEHLRKKLDANRENVAMIIVHNISNLLLLVPLWKTGTISYSFRFFQRFF